MKIYRVTTEVQVTKTIQYIVEAETFEDAHQQILDGNERDEGEEIDNNINWSTETISQVKYIETI